MSSIPWNEFLSLFAKNLRMSYEVEIVREGIDPENLIEFLHLPAIQYTVPKPCQITVFEFSYTPRIVWIFAFEKSKPDMYVKVEKVKESLEDFLESHNEYSDYGWALKLVSMSRKELKLYPKEDYVSFRGENFFGIIFFQNPTFKYNPKQFALRIFSESRMLVLRSVQQSKIARSTSEILGKVEKTDSVKAIAPEVQSIREALDKLKKIDEYDQKLVSIEDDLLGVRRLVGTQAFGEWKTLLSEIDKLDTRIDALSDIKDAYDKVLTQQAEVIKQQSSFMNWIKYSTILVPIAVASIAIIDILIRYFLGVL